jgi:Fe-S-cluster-containing dehydrogenase component/formate-dependent nitrite reductase membrane component NrfD
MKYAKIIDNRKCIGCHACSVACKEENQVPLGVFRTWVKYVEKGAFPNTRRHFQVTRCNQCENPPCVRICPTAAMYQRPDGIVEFDNAQCIGCKACLEACPYDAIYVDPDSHTAAKCHFCAHRIDRGLEPACVIVCPERAIIVGDMDDSNSQVSQLLAREQVAVRKPEQGTRPKLFYIRGESAALDPLAAARPDSWMWADTGDSAYVPQNGNGNGNGHDGWHDGPIQRTASFATGFVQTVYDVPHEVPWGWKVSTYLWTKSIGAGALFIPALLLGFGGQLPILFATVAAFLSLVFVGITTVLLVWDLKRPERFFKIVLRPQKRSWLALGSFVLMGFSALAGLWFLASAGQADAVRGILALPQGLLRTVQTILDFPVALLAILSAVYSAFLFSQAEGRDLWQSSLLPLNLFLQATVAGSALLLIVSLGMGTTIPLLAPILAVALFALLATQLLGDFGVPQATTNARQGHHLMTHGRYGRYFWGGILGQSLGLILALLSIAVASVPLAALGGLAALAGLLAIEHAWVQAGQLVPNS